MKKFVSIILAVMLVLGLSATAFAAGEYDVYGKKSGWWYDYDESESPYLFDEKEQKDVLYDYAEAMSKAEGLAALYRLISKLQENGMYLVRYEVVKEKTANHVYWIEAMNQYGEIKGCYFATFTHDSAEKVMSDMIAGKKIKYYSIFLTTYVEGQKIKNYDETERITGFDVLMDDAIDQFVYKLYNFDFDDYDSDYDYDYEYPDYWDGGVG